ncbi:MAG: hypothetical protein LAT54_00650 [Cryomorphaceae bacterium]|nr:hypothetical protein [Cryomorphaceae bacterium]
MLKVFTLFLSRVFIHSQFWVALMAFFLTLLTLFELKSDAFKLAISVGMLTWGGYTYIRSFSNANTLNHRHYKALKLFYLPITLVSLSYGIYVLYAFTNHLLITTLTLLPSALLVFLYPLKKSWLLSIREFPGIKLIVISFSWLWLTTCIPLIVIQDFNPLHAASMFLQRFLLMMVWILPFDIRDLNIDKKQIKTIPQQIGVDSTKQLIYIIVFILQLSYLLTAWLSLTQVIVSLSYIAGLEVLSLLVYFSKPSKDSGYYSILVESTPMYILFMLMLIVLVFI